MRAPLTVRVFDGSTSRMVTRHTTGLQFRKTAPGGHADASCRLSLPADTFADLGPADRLWIYDARTGATIWEGYTTNPGALTGPDGQGYDLSALGGQSLASDQSERLVYLDKSLDGWQRSTGSSAAGTFNQDALPDGSSFGDTPGLVVQFPPGQPIAPPNQIGAIYNGFRGSLMKVGGILANRQGGVADSDYQVEVYNSGTTIRALNLSTSATFIRNFAGQTYDALFATGLASLSVRLVRRTGGATNIATDTVWNGWVNLWILGQLVDRYGADLDMSLVSHTTTSPVEAYVLAHEVAEDLLGRLLTFCDPDTAVIDTTTYEIDQLAYSDAVTAADILDELIDLEPDITWEILESNVVGLHRFNFREWPTSPRYLIPPSVVVEQPGSDSDLANRITVNWTDEKGKERVTVRTSTVEALGSRVRDAEAVTIPAGRGSQSMAERLGDQILAAKATPPRAGTTEVDRPIMDLYRGAMVQPWEIEPGYLVRVVATGDDLRLTEVEYNDDSCSSKLVIGDPVLTVPQRIARLERSTTGLMGNGR